MKRFPAFAFLVLLGCAGSSDKPADSNPPPKDELKLTLTKQGSEIEATAEKGTLRIRNVGGVMVEVCDDNQCAPLQPAGEMEFPVNRKVVYHLASVEDGEAKVEVKLISEGKPGTLRVR